MGRFKPLMGAAAVPSHANLGTETLGFWYKYTMARAGTMPFHRDFLPGF